MWQLKRGGEALYGQERKERVGGWWVKATEKSSWILLNIGFVEGCVRAIRGKEFSVSSKLSDRLWERERDEKNESVMRKGG